jgi:hypothetical protein
VSLTTWRARSALSTETRRGWGAQEEEFDGSAPPDRAAFYNSALACSREFTDSYSISATVSAMWFRCEDVVYGAPRRSSFTRPASHACVAPGRSVAQPTLHLIRQGKRGQTAGP